MQEGTGEEKNKGDKKEDLPGILHKGGVLPSLRTYQGDVASFIQSKDKSIAELALKKREEENKQQELENIQEKAEENNGEEKPPERHSPKISKFYALPEKATKRKSGSPSFLITAISILLLVGSLSVASYIAYLHFKDQPTNLSPSGIMPIVQHEKTISLDAETLNKSSLENAVNASRAKKEDRGVISIQMGNISLESFLTKVGWNTPKPLIRNLGSDFMVGLYNSSIKQDFFIIFKVKDYGIAFRDMLLWEDNMFNDFAPFINYKLSSSTPDVSGYRFRDLIVKNKDTRALSITPGRTNLIYTFLNENTILITESEESIVALVNAFISGSTTR